MSIEDIQEKIAKIEKQKKQLTTEIYRLPIANRYKAILDRENELYTVSFIPDYDNFVIDDWWTPIWAEEIYHLCTLSEVFRKNWLSYRTRHIIDVVCKNN